MLAQYLLGVYGRLDRERFEREWRNWFAGVELASLDNWTEAERALALVRERRLLFGIHFPLVRGDAQTLLHPLVCSPIAAKREQALAAVRTALFEAKRLGAQYLLLHFPKPALLDGALDWSDWRFAQSGEAIAATGGRQQAEQTAALAFSRLAGLSAASGMPLVLELDILHPWYYCGLLQQLFRAHPRLGLCLDTGRLHLLEATDARFNALELTRTLLPHVTNLHLWTTRLGTNKFGGHHPLLPELDSQPGWGKMGDLLQALAACKTARVLFEHRADLISAADLERCYHWVATALAGA